MFSVRADRLTKMDTILIYSAKRLAPKETKIKRISKDADTVTIETSNCGRLVLAHTQRVEVPRAWHKAS